MLLCGYHKIVEKLVPVGPLFKELVQPIILTRSNYNYIMLEQTSLIISRVGVK